MSVGGISVGGTGVSVGGTGVAEGGIGVLVGGTAVFVGAGRGVPVRSELLGAAVSSRGGRVLLGVTVTKCRGVSEGRGVREAVLVRLAVTVAVGTN